MYLFVFNSLQIGIEKLKKQISEQKIKNIELEHKINLHKQTSDEQVLILYKEYLLGLITSKKINSSKRSALDSYQKRNNISSNDHEKILLELGLTKETFHEMKDFSQPWDECYVCYEPPRNHMFIPCNHVAICPECAGMCHKFIITLCILFSIKCNQFIVFCNPQRKFSHNHTRIKFVFCATEKFKRLKKYSIRNESNCACRY